METDLVALLARSGLSDDEYARGVEMVRTMAARIELADEMARQVIAASCYLPTGCVGAAVEYTAVYVPSDAVAA